jgi:hypothetical protein
MGINKDPRVSQTENLSRLSNSLKLDLETEGMKKPTARDIATIIQSYMLLNKEAPDEKDKKSMDLLEDVYSLVTKYTSYIMRTKVDPKIERIVRPRGGISPEMSKRIRISTRDEILTLLRTLDLTRIHDYLEPEFDIKIEKMIQKQISALYSS